MGTIRKPTSARPGAVRRTATLGALLAQANIGELQLAWLGFFFAALGAMALWWASNVAGLAFTAACVLMMWLWNALSPTPAPPRAGWAEGIRISSDALILIALGHGTGLPLAGWLGAGFAIVAGALGATPALPVAVPHARERAMALLLAGCVLGALERQLWGGFFVPAATSIALALLWLVVSALRGRQRHLSRNAA